MQAGRRTGRKRRVCLVGLYDPDEGSTSNERNQYIEINRNVRRGAPRLEQRFPGIFHQREERSGSNEHNGSAEEKSTALLTTLADEEVQEGGGDEEVEEGGLDEEVEEVGGAEDLAELQAEAEDDIISLGDYEMFDEDYQGDIGIPGWEGNVIVENHYWSDYEFDNPPSPTPCPYGHLLLPKQDINAGQIIAREVSSLSGSFNMKLLRVLSDQQTVTNAFTSNILKLMKTAKEEDLKSLPTDYRSLRNAIPVKSLSCWLSHVCLQCQIQRTYKHQLGLRQRHQFPVCHKVLDYSSDHYLVTDVAEVLALVLPSVWRWRKEEYLPPHMKKLMAKNSMDFKTDITLTVCSDGAQFFNSSTLSIWPVLAYVDGIPFHVQRDSVFFLGAVAARDDGKTFQVNCMMNDVLKQIERLNGHKFNWMFRGEIIASRVLVSRVVADSPARSALQGITAHNAVYGCHYCLHFEKGHYYTHFESLSYARSDESLRRIYNSDAFDPAKPENQQGIKWKSMFERLPFDLVDGFPPDVMHAVYLGVMKLLIQMWLSKPKTIDNKRQEREAYQLTMKQQETLDARLQKIRPPERTKRKPAELKKAGMWKAHELSLFLFHYGPIILQDILAAEYYDHYLQLVAGLVLLSVMITEDNVRRAQVFLDTFSERIPQLYFRSCQRFNVHLLRHLPRFCELHGILPLFSMYPFESHIHTLGKYVTNVNGVVLQLFRKSMQNLMLNCHEDAFKKYDRSSGWLDFPCPWMTVDKEMNNWEVLCVVSPDWPQNPTKPGSPVKVTWSC